MIQEVKKGHMYLSFENEIPKIVSAQPDPREDDRREKINTNLLKIPLILLVVS